MEQSWSVDGPRCAIWILVQSASVADLVLRHTSQGARQAAGLLTQLADTLESSAGLAEGHAQRCEQAGRAHEAAGERHAARSAHEAAQRARSQAEQWLNGRRADYSSRSGRRLDAAADDYGSFANVLWRSNGTTADDARP
jgi:hypothetical protein